MAIDVIDIARYIPLDRAIMSGNWEVAKVILERDEGALTAEIDFGGHTPLHIAIGTPHLHFVENLLDMIQPELLPSVVSKEDKSTALHSAALCGNVNAAKMLVGKNKYLLFMADSNGDLPIHTAIINFHKTTFKYLLAVSERTLISPEKVNINVRLTTKKVVGFSLR